VYAFDEWKHDFGQSDFAWRGCLSRNKFKDDRDQIFSVVEYASKRFCPGRSHGQKLLRASRCISALICRADVSHRRQQEIKSIMNGKWSATEAKAKSLVFVVHLKADYVSIWKQSRKFPPTTGQGDSLS
jgi:hypothetical protein